MGIEFTSHWRRTRPSVARLAAARVPLVAVVALSLLAASCSSGSVVIDQAQDAEPTEEPRATVAADEPTAEPAPQPTATAEPAEAPTATAVPEPTPTAAPATTVYWGSELQVGDCFNRLPGNPAFEPPDIVDCDQLHDEELYAKAELPDGDDVAFPGQDALFERVANELCDDATVDFLGETFDLVPVVTYILYPLEEEWDAGDRFVGCSAAGSADEEKKIGTAAGGTLDSSDILLARSALARDGEEFEDWTLFFEHGSIDTILSLTDGEFDLPLRRPFIVPQGFLFTAIDEGAVGNDVSGFGYRWETQEFENFGSLLPGQEIASTLATEDGYVIFAGRQDENDDWDLYSALDGEFDLLADGAGNQQYPTLTPDGDQVVFHDQGDLWVIDVDGSNLRQLTSGPANDWESVVSPDGTTVVFASDRDGNDDLWSVPLDGGEPVNLTNHPADEVWPTFSEDGSLIYFSSDRLDPENDVPRLMMMRPDGSDVSWFAGAAPGSQSVVVPQDLAAEIVASTPTLRERYDYELVRGEPGTTRLWGHSSGRLTAELPAGWRVVEVNERIGFVAGPRPDRIFETWNVDGVIVNIWEGETSDEFFDNLDRTDVFANDNCEQFDGTDGVEQIADDLMAFSANFDCGGDGATGGVLAFYNTSTGVGITVEGQRDNLPNAEIDNETLAAIARSIQWR